MEKVYTIKYKGKARFVEYHHEGKRRLVYTSKPDAEQGILRLLEDFGATDQYKISAVMPKNNDVYLPVRNIYT